MALITQAEYARRRGVSRQAVSKAVKAGRLPLVNGLVDPEVADRAWAATTDMARRMDAALPPPVSTEPEPARPRHPTPQPRPQVDAPEASSETALDPAQQRYITSRAFKESYAALSAKLEYETKLGRLIPVEEVQAAAFDIGRRVRDTLTGIADRCAALAANRSAEDVHGIISAEVDRACKEVEKWASGQAQPK